MKKLTELNSSEFVGPCDAKLQRLSSWENEMWGDHPSEWAGAFLLESDVDKGRLAIIATSGDGWDHVSVSRLDRCPTWLEMQQVHRTFFEDDETAMELHVPTADHVNVHDYCLHLWRPHHSTIPTPPKDFV